MAKGKKDDDKKSAVGSSAEKMSYKRSIRQAQSQKDRETTIQSKGWVASTKTVTDNDRCEVCNNPSAVVRQGNARCKRCDRTKKQKVAA